MYNKQQGEALIVAVAVIQLIFLSLTATDNEARVLGESVRQAFLPVGLL